MVFYIHVFQRCSWHTTAMAVVSLPGRGTGTREPPLGRSSWGTLSTGLLSITPNAQEFLFQTPFLTARETITYVKEKKKLKTPLVKNSPRIKREKQSFWGPMCLWSPQLEPRLQRCRGKSGQEEGWWAPPPPRAPSGPPSSRRKSYESETQGVFLSQFTNSFRWIAWMGLHNLMQAESIKHPPKLSWDTGCFCRTRGTKMIVHSPRWEVDEQQFSSWGQKWTVPLKNCGNLTQWAFPISHEKWPAIKGNAWL